MIDNTFQTLLDKNINLEECILWYKVSIFQTFSTFSKTNIQGHDVQKVIYYRETSKG
jgi:hypothetical protein